MRILFMAVLLGITCAAGCSALRGVSRDGNRVSRAVSERPARTPLPGVWWLPVPN